MNIAVDAYLDNNLGDDLMIKLFANYFSEHKIYIFRNDTIIKKSFDDVTNITFFDQKQYNKSLNDIDLHVTIGGSMFILDSFKKWVRFRHRIHNARILRKHGIRSAIIGANLGPFDKNDIGLLLSRWELKYKDLITVRDRMSYDLLSDKKVKSVTHLFPDIVFSQSIEKQATTYSLGISVYRSKDTRYDNFLNYKNLTTIVDQHIKNYGGKVALFAFDSEDENDLVAAHYIKELSTYKKNIEIIPYLNNSNYFIEEFAKCEKILGIRFHSSVLALSLGIPLFSIYYSNKTINLMKDLKLQEFTVSLSDFDSKKKQIEIDMNDNNLAMLSSNQRKQILNKSLGHFKEVEKLINQIIMERQR